MMKFILKRPIATFMIALAILILGVISSFEIPTSLLPDIPVPRITVQVSYPNQTARSLETNVIRQLRNQLQQIDQLKIIETESRDGFGLLKLKFDYGVSTDLAFIETNEKVDMAMNNLPRDLPRPRVIKASTSDIPVLYLSVSNLKDSKEAFLDLSQFTFNVLKRRLEQLPSIAIADISGHLFSEIKIVPNLSRLQSLGIDQNILIQSINSNNFEIGDLLIENGIYQYNLRFSSPLQSKGDIENIRLNIDNNIYQLRDLADVEVVSEQIRGASSTNGERAIQIALIKQADASIYDMNETLNEFIIKMQNEYPDLNFVTHQDQTNLLKLSIDNLKYSLLLSSSLAILIIFLFMQDFKSPLIIGISIPLALFISFFLFYIFKISINIISLSGLILGVGMMIDNSIIVIDNIMQQFNENDSLIKACIKGITEIISPLVSSVLTTCMVFFPLIFLSGIAGSLFYDQAVAVAIGLVSSLLVSIFIIPSIFLLIYKKKFVLKKGEERLAILYKKGFKLFYKKKHITLGIALLFLSLNIFLIQYLPINKLPILKQSEMLIAIDWNKNIAVEENIKKTQDLFLNIKDISFVIEAAEQRYLLQQESTQNFSEAKVFLKAKSPSHLKDVKEELLKRLALSNAVVNFLPPRNIFQYIFGSNNDELILEVKSKDKLEIPSEGKINEIENLIPFPTKDLLLQNTYNLQIDYENLLLYNVSYQRLINEVKTLLQRNFVSELRNVQRFVPIRMGYEDTNIQESLNTKFVFNKDGNLIPLYQLVNIKKELRYKTIYGKRDGEYLKFTPEDNIVISDKLTETVRKKFKSSEYSTNFSGSFLEEGLLVKELIVIIGISLLLLYLILAAQFNSLLQPLIILSEIPINIGGALLMVWIFGSDLNIMTGIGIVVMAGIVINDSIIKIHTINSLRQSGLNIDESIEKAGVMRLKPILMTSLTTILALLPFLFISGLGADLQKPLALSVIGGLFIGTFISLYFIPVLYRFLTK